MSDIQWWAITGCVLFQAFLNLALLFPANNMARWQRVQDKWIALLFDRMNYRDGDR